ncbi:MAG: hypothetical protein ACI358_07750 [Candidatus Limimorpha sp.]
MAFISLTGHAQPLQNLKKAKAYFTELIQQLEPIEGIYDVKNTIEVYSACAGWESIKQHCVCAVLKSSDLYFVHSIEGDVKGLIGSIEKMSGPKSYSFEKVDGNGNMKKIHFQQNDLFSFELKEENTNRSAKSRVFTKFIKKYPTIEMYANLEQAENAGYAFKASYIRNLVELLPTGITMPQTNLLAGKALPKQVDLASKAVCMIIVNGD